MRPRFTLIAIAAAFVFAAAPAFGQSSEAVKHFERGKQLRDEGRCKEAIPELQKSVSLERTIGAFYNLGVCFDTLAEKPLDLGGQSKTALKRQAYAAYKNAEQLASERKDDRLREIGAQITAFLRNSPHLRLALAERPEGLKIKVDDEDVPESDYAPEIVVFTNGAGQHVVEAHAPGYEMARYRSDGAAAVPVVLRKETKDTPNAKFETRWSTQHWAGLGILAAGVGVCIIPTYIGVDYAVERGRVNRDLSEFCEPGADGKPDCTSTAIPMEKREQALQAKQANDDLETSITDKIPIIVTTGAAGLIMIGVGAYLFFSAEPERIEKSEKPEKRPAFRLVPSFGATHRALSIVGEF